MSYLFLAPFLFLTLNIAEVAAIGTKATNVHEMFHRYTTSDPSKIWEGPILDLHRKDIDTSYYPLITG